MAVVRVAQAVLANRRTPEAITSPTAVERPIAANANVPPAKIRRPTSIGSRIHPFQSPSSSLRTARSFHAHAAANRAGDSLMP